MAVRRCGGDSGAGEIDVFARGFNPAAIAGRAGGAGGEVAADGDGACHAGGARAADQADRAGVAYGRVGVDAARHVDDIAHRVLDHGRLKLNRAARDGDGARVVDQCPGAFGCARHQRRRHRDLHEIAAIEIKRNLLARAEGELAERHADGARV